MEVTLIEMLNAREARAIRQRELLLKYNKPLISFTMNIAGPEKNNFQIKRGYELGKRLLKGQLMAKKIPVLHFEEICKNTGNEAIYVLDSNAMTIKAVTSSIENAMPVGRLFDMDVIKPEGDKVERTELNLSPRKCLICGQQAQICARSRTHSVNELQLETKKILAEALNEYDTDTIASLACKSLLYEVATTPKPGLVDRDNSGSHKDMDFFTFQASTAALFPYFKSCAKTGIETRNKNASETFELLRGIGKIAEGEMLLATNGVNTHKGAIFSMGIFCGALGRIEPSLWREPKIVLDECAKMAAGLTSHDYANITNETADTAGEKLFLKYGISGARGQAEAGFPAVLSVGLPKLEDGLRRGLSINDAGCAVLLAMMACTIDTNIINRSSVEEHRCISRDIAELLQDEPFPSRETLKKLDAEFIDRNISPGGTADLLSLVYMLHFLKEEYQ